MIPLNLTTYFDPAFPQFPIPRVLADGAFEPQTPPLDVRTAFAGAFVDTGAPYVIIPYVFHANGWIKVYCDLGQQPYRTASVAGAPLMQRFVELGLRFFVNGSPPSIVRPFRPLSKPICWTEALVPSAAS